MRDAIHKIHGFTDSLLYFSRTREGENREDKDSSGVENIRGKLR